jgi:hypothetical protein
MMLECKTSRPCRYPKSQMNHNLMAVGSSVTLGRKDELVPECDLFFNVRTHISTTRMPAGIVTSMPSSPVDGCAYALARIAARIANIGMPSFAS